MRNQNAVLEWRDVDLRRFQTEIEPANRLAVLRGLVDHWPAVKHARESPRALAQFLHRHCSDKPVLTFLAEPKVKGRKSHGDPMAHLPEAAVAPTRA